MEERVRALGRDGQPVYDTGARHASRSNPRQDNKRAWELAGVYGEYLRHAAREYALGGVTGFEYGSGLVSPFLVVFWSS